MDMTHATPALLTALAAAHRELENASKNAANPHFRSRYADLAEVINTIRPTLAKHGLSMLQSTAFDGELVHVTTVLAHAEGGYVSSVASAVPAKADSQGIGACTTYLRRYSAAAMTLVAQEDDDGNSAAHNAPPRKVGERASRIAGIESDANALGIAQKVLEAVGAKDFASMTDQQIATARRGLDKRLAERAQGEAA